LSTSKITKIKRLIIDIGHLLFRLLS